MRAARVPAAADTRALPHLKAPPLLLLVPQADPGCCREAVAAN